MAWRDSRTSRRKLLLFSCSIVLGIAALAAIGSLGWNLEQAVEEQTRSLLGADLAIQSRDPFTPAANRLFQTLGGQQSREISFSSMVFFPRTRGTRLVQVRALSGGFPYYGKFVTDPPGAVAQLRRGNGALVEETLLRQFDAKVGDEIRVGKLTTRIAGRLERVPGEAVALSIVAPRVYISMNDLPRTGLLQQASLARYGVYFKLPKGTDVTKRVAEIRPQLEQLRLRADTVAHRKRELGRSLDNLYHFLNLAAFIALFLGGVGVASAIHVHVKQKVRSVAVLRCLGGSIPQTFAIYLAQGVGLGVIGAAFGGALGIAIQATLPKILADFIPFTYQFHTAWIAVGRAMAIGFAICLLFTLLPLLAVRRVPPLAALRSSVEPARARKDPLVWLVVACLAAGVVAFALSQSRNWRIGLGFSLGLGLVFAVLTVMAGALASMSRRFVSAKLPFTVRQGLANLHRPNNRTLLLLLALGLGTFLMTSLYLVQQTLLNQLALATGGNQPNAVLFDVQNAQVPAVARLVRSLHLPLLDNVPVVAMRLSSINGRSVDSILSDRRPHHRHRWAYVREYRSTYRSRLRDGEKIIAGKWIPQVAGDTNPVPISLEQGIAHDLNVGLGDELVFNVQGVPITTRIASLRVVEWRRIQPNFFVVFPRGVLESAPAMHVLVTHVPSSKQSARLQRAVVQDFPNVSVIDLTLVLQTVNAILGKISFVIRFLAMFTVVTGLLVLVTALLTGRYQRIQESVLLRTLGASRRQIFRILLVEYCSLGVLSALTGILLAVFAAWLLAKWVFHVPFAPDPLALLVAILIVPAVTVATGFLMSRGVLDHPPLAILRAEG